MPGETAPTLTPWEQMDQRCTEIIRLISENIGSANVKKFHRPITATAPDPTTFPAIFVQPRSWDPKLTTTAKYELTGKVIIYCYASGNDAERVGQDVIDMVGQLDKLFSNNALDDRLLATFTNKYFVNPGFWIHSRFGPGDISEVLPFQRENGEVLLCAARIPFEFLDVLIH